MATVTTSRFELRGADGGPLRGEVRTAGRGTDRPAVIICHGFKGFKDWGFFPHVAHRVAQAGMSAVTFNFSGSGIGPDGESFSERARFGHATLSNDLADLEAVAMALLAEHLVPGLARPSALGLVGHSRGGAVALLLAARSSNCRALVTWAAVSGFLRWDEPTVRRWRAEGQIDVVNARTGDVLPLYTDCLADLDAHGSGRLDLEAAARAVTAPWLIIHGAADESVPLSEGERLAGWARPEHARFEVIPGGSHTLGARHPWAGTTPQLERGVDLTVGWLCRHLL